MQIFGHHCQSLRHFWPIGRHTSGQFLRAILAQIQLIGELLKTFASSQKHKPASQLLPSKNFQHSIGKYQQWALG